MSVDRGDKSRVKKNLTALKVNHGEKPATAVNEFREKIRGEVSTGAPKKISVEDEDKSPAAIRSRKLTDFDNDTKKSIDDKKTQKSPLNVNQSIPSEHSRIISVKRQITNAIGKMIKKDKRISRMK